MSILIGLTPDEHGTSALALGAMLARSVDEGVVVVVVVPTPWPPNPYRPDAEYLALQESAGQQALAQARTVLGHDLSAEFLLHRARSVSSGLLEVADRTCASWVVLGSASSGLLGQITLGGIAERVMHSSALPVALAPRGYGASAAKRVRRVTVGFGRADPDSDLLTTAAGVAVSIGAELRVACFAVRPMVYAGTIEEEAEELVVEAWATHLESDIDRALEAATGSVAVRAQSAVGQGASWVEALADVGWTAGDLLVIGASSSPLSRFFLGSHATKVVRNSTVPVLLVPRSLLSR